MNSDEVRLENLKDILNNLSSIHACCLHSGEQKKSECYEFNLISQTYLNIMEKYDEDSCDKIIFTPLLESIKDVLSSDKENLYIKINHDFYPVTQIGDTVPVVFDLLLTIFYNTNSIERQQFFHDLIDYYYFELKNNLKLDIILKKDTFEHHIKKFLPLAKLECFHLLHGNLKKAEECKAIVRELKEHILYSNLSRQDCYKIVNNYLSSGQYNFIEYKITALEDIVGYLGQYFKVLIKIKYKNEEKELNLFAKSLPKTCSTLLSLALASFKKEEFIYKDFFQKVKSCGFTDILDFSAKCYFVRSNDIVVLEDLAIQNYKSSHPREPADYDLVVSIIKQLAKFHACSLILEEKLSEGSQVQFRIGEKFADFLEEITFAYLGNLGAINKYGARLVVKYMIDKFPEICQKLTMDEFKQLAARAFDMMYEHVKESKKYRNVICHGDLWTSNILTKRNKNNKITSCRLVDYQIIRYCPPTVDLLFLIYTNTGKNTRNKFLSEFVAIYYKELSDILGKYDIDINTIYDCDTFSKCCEDIKSTCICQALCYLQILLIPKEKLEELFSDKKKSEHFLTAERIAFYEKEKIWEHEMFRTRIKELIEDLYDTCVKQK